MTMCVIDLLEVVDVDDGERERKVCILIPTDLVLQIAEEEAAILNASELVLEDKTRRILPHVLEEVEELLIRHDGPLSAVSGPDRPANCKYAATLQKHRSGKWGYFLRDRSHRWTMSHCGPRSWNSGAKRTSPFLFCWQDRARVVPRRSPASYGKVLKHRHLQGASAHSCGCAWVKSDRQEKPWPRSRLLLRLHRD